MSNEQQTEQTQKKNNGCLIGCGCFLIAIITGILFISGFLYFIATVTISNVKPDLDNFFEKYNNHEMNYICQNLLPDSVTENECIEVLTNMYNEFGKELEYKFPFHKGAYINVSSSNGDTKKEITTIADFEKEKNVTLEFKIHISKSGRIQIYHFGYK